MPINASSAELRVAVIAVLNDNLRMHLAHQNRHQVAMTPGI